MKRKTWFWALTPVALALSLYGCGNGSDSDLAVDNNAQSCSVVSGTGSAVVVGSGLPGDPAAPEAASGYRLGYKAKQSSNYMVVANTPLATKAGCDVLKAGGTAVDAAVAVQAVLGLVEPQSSGLGGGAFMMFYDADSAALTVYDGRETAPASATPELFYENGKPLPFVDAVLTAVNLGDDADTTGAVCGQIAGAFYGYQAIPQKWLDRLAMCGYITELADRLYQLAAT